jgi:hypothetical protein
MDWNFTAGALHDNCPNPRAAPYRLIPDVVCVGSRIGRSLLFAFVLASGRLFIGFVCRMVDPMRTTLPYRRGIAGRPYLGSRSLGVSR